MPCMCGDNRCWSCGPAQGNYKCQICGVWTDEGGCSNPSKCEAEAKKQDNDSYIDYLVDSIYQCEEATPELTAKIRDLINTNNIEELEILAGKKERKANEN